MRGPQKARRSGRLVCGEVPANVSKKRRKVPEHQHQRLPHEIHTPILMCAPTDTHTHTHTQKPSVYATT